jgi:hypothetical protein
LCSYFRVRAVVAVAATLAVEVGASADFPVALRMAERSEAEAVVE